MFSFVAVSFSHISFLSFHLSLIQALLPLSTQHCSLLFPCLVFFLLHACFTLINLKPLSLHFLYFSSSVSPSPLSTSLLPLPFFSFSYFSCFSSSLFPPLFLFWSLFSSFFLIFLPFPHVPFFSPLLFSSLFLFSLLIHPHLFLFLSLFRHWPLLTLNSDPSAFTYLLIGLIHILLMSTRFFFFLSLPLSSSPTFSSSYFSYSALLISTHFHRFASPPLFTSPPLPSTLSSSWFRPFYARSTTLFFFSSSSFPSSHPPRFSFSWFSISSFFVLLLRQRLLLFFFFLVYFIFFLRSLLHNFILFNILLPSPSLFSYDFASPLLLPHLIFYFNATYSFFSSSSLCFLQFSLKFTLFFFSFLVLNHDLISLFSSFSCFSINFPFFEIHSSSTFFFF